MKSRCKFGETTHTREAMHSTDIARVEIGLKAYGVPQIKKGREPAYAAIITCYSRDDDAIRSFQVVEPTGNASSQVHSYLYGIAAVLTLLNEMHLACPTLIITDLTAVVGSIKRENRRDEKLKELWERLDALLKEREVAFQVRRTEQVISLMLADGLVQVAHGMGAERIVQEVTKWEPLSREAA
jgi:ribonuclease HI